MEYLAIYPDWLEGLRHLSGDGVKAWLLTCVKAAENDGEGVEIDKAPEEIRGVLGFTISAIRAQAKKRRTLAENGRKGGRPKAVKKPNESKRKQTKAQSNTKDYTNTNTNTNTNKYDIQTNLVSKFVPYVFCELGNKYGSLLRDAEKKRLAFFAGDMLGWALGEYSERTAKAIVEELVICKRCRDENGRAIEHPQAFLRAIAEKRGMV